MLLQLFFEITPIVHRACETGFEGNLHDTPYLFTGFYGCQTDSNGLVYLRERYYNTLTRRFINPDPARDGWNWYAYAGGDPMGFVDPTGLGQQRTLDILQQGLAVLGMLPGVGEIFDGVNAGISVARGNYSDAAIHLASAVPGLGNAVAGAKMAGGVASASFALVKIQKTSGGVSSLNGATQMFTSFSSLKRNLGSAGSGNAWHHIVEQSSSNINRFGSNAIHNTQNVIKLPTGKGTIHNQISSFYSTKQPFSEGLTVRKWLQKQSYDAQFEFGVKTIKQFGGSKYLP